jgi:hypothetical protein
MPGYFEQLEIIAQPCLTSKLRYRRDFDRNKNRRGVLRSRNNPNYRYPAIRVRSFLFLLFKKMNFEFFFRSHKSILMSHNTITFVFVLSQSSMKKLIVVTFIRMSWKILVSMNIMIGKIMQFGFLLNSMIKME